MDVGAVQVEEVAEVEALSHLHLLADGVMVPRDEVADDVGPHSHHVAHVEDVLYVVGVVLFAEHGCEGASHGSWSSLPLI